MKDELLDITKKLIAFKTTKDEPRQIRKCLDYVKAYCKDSGIIIKEFADGGSPSLFLTLQETATPALLLNGHIDVVEGEDEQFKPHVEEGKLFGRGAIDMKAGVASMLVLLKTFAQCKERPDIGLMIVTDEERGGHHGTRFLVEQGWGGGFVVGPEPNQAKDEDTLGITIAHKGVIWLKVSARGIATHASRPWLGRNAAEVLIERFGQIKAMFPNTTPEDRWRSTVNLGWVQAGSSPNVVPDTATMKLDIRFTEAEDPANLIQAIKALPDIEVEILEMGAMLKNDPEDLRITSLQDICEEVTGKECKLLQEHGSSDLRYTNAKGMTSVVFGPKGKHYHGKGEYVEIESLVQHFEILKAYIEQHLC